MTHLQNSLLWKSQPKHENKQCDAFADPLEQPEWKNLTPLIKLFQKLIHA